MSAAKHLILMRHAKSDSARPGQADRERPLNERGRRDAEKVGRWLVAQQSVPQLILCSTAARARETAECVCAAWDAAVVVSWSEQLYLAAPEQILAAIKADAGDAERVMVVGHNPGMEHLVGLLTGTCGHFPTAATAILANEVARWAKISPHHGWSMVGQMRPKSV